MFDVLHSDVVIPAFKMNENESLQERKLIIFMLISRHTYTLGANEKYTEI